MTYEEIQNQRELQKIEKESILKQKQIINELLKKYSFYDAKCLTKTLCKLLSKYEHKKFNYEEALFYDDSGKIIGKGYYIFSLDKTISFKIPYQEKFILERKKAYNLINISDIELFLNGLNLSSKEIESFLKYFFMKVFDYRINNDSEFIEKKELSALSEKYLKESKNEITNHQISQNEATGENRLEVQKTKPLHSILYLSLFEAISFVLDYFYNTNCQMDTTIYYEESSSFRDKKIFVEYQVNKLISDGVCLFSYNKEINYGIITNNSKYHLENYVNLKKYKKLEIDFYEFKEELNILIHKFPKVGEFMNRLEERYLNGTKRITDDEIVEDLHYLFYNKHEVENYGFTK